MKTPLYTNQFKKDYKLSERRGKNLDKLKSIMSDLVNEIKLPPHNKDHALTGNYIGCRECHVEPDWLLIYELSDKEICFMRTGTHSDLFG